MLFILTATPQEARRCIIEEVASFSSLSDRAKTSFYDYVKRTMDIVMAILLSILSFPLWMIIAVLIASDSKGSVLIVQDRVGKNGKIFKMYKFRTMYSRHDLYAPSPIHKNDERITKTGNWLRKTSLDELPQLINVLLGSMSLVGPRPEMPFVVSTYNEFQKQRLLVTPGLTGLWQVFGRKDLPLTENLEFDLYYIYNKSFILDMMILWKTPGAIISGRGAY